MPVTEATDKQVLREQLLGQFPFFSELPVLQLERILGEAELLRAAAGSVLFDARQPCRGFPLLLEGCLLGQTDYTATAVAERDTLMISVPPALFHELMLQFEPFRRFVFGMYGERLAEVMELVEEVAVRRLDMRLAQLLTHCGPVVQATHQKLADELGSVREIVSRLLRGFEGRGWVRLERERVTVLDPRFLSGLAAGCP